MRILYVGQLDPGGTCRARWTELQGLTSDIRSFEISGCGAFLLAMRTPQHLEAYREGRKAEFLGDHRELVDKVRYYLEHESERATIARGGHERCTISGYSWRAITARDWKEVIALYERRRLGRPAA